MRAAAVLLTAACVLTLFPAIASPTSPPAAPHAAQTGYEAGSSLMIPKWRLAVRIYGGFVYTPEVGIYRRVGSRHELGLGVSGDLDFREDEETSVVQDTTDTRTYYTTSESDYSRIELYSELRRWNRISDDVTWYFGPRASFELGDVEYATDSRLNEERVYEVGVSLIAGGDLKLLEHLSLSFSFLPMRISYSWLDIHSKYVDHQGDRDRIVKYYREHRRFLVDFEPRATAFLNLVF